MLNKCYLWIGVDHENQTQHGLSSHPLSLPAGITLCECKTIRVTARLKKQAQQWLTHCLTLLKTHPLQECFQLLNTLTNPVSKALTQNIFRHLIEGMSLSDTLLQYPHLFSSQLCQWISMGEHCGKLSDMGLQVLQNQENEQRQIKKMYQQLTYPLLLLISSCFLFVGLILWLIPSMRDLYADMNQSIPPLIQHLLGIKNTLPEIGLALIALIATAITTYRSTAGQQCIDKLLARSAHYQQHVLSGWLYCLSQLLKASVPLDKSLQHAKQCLPGSWDNPINRLIKELQEGQLLSQCLRDFPGTSEELCESVAIAELNHSLAATLEKLAQDLHEQRAQQWKKLTQALQPSLILIMAAVIGSLFYIIYQPMLGMGFHG